MVPENEAIARRFIEELWNQGNLPVADELIAAEHVHHLGGDELRGPDGVKGAVLWLRAGFPDLEFEIHDLISDRDRAALRWTASGTHLGRFFDLDPTGRHARGPAATGSGSAPVRSTRSGPSRTAARCTTSSRLPTTRRPDGLTHIVDLTQEWVTTCHRFVQQTILSLRPLAGLARWPVYAIDMGKSSGRDDQYL